MATTSVAVDNDQEMQFTCFYLGDTLYGYEIDLVQEINDELNITKVPLSPDYVMGIMNLRGQIITVIDQKKKLGLSSSSSPESSRVIIIKSQNEYIGLMVDKIAEVITCTAKDIAKPPSNVHGVQGKMFKGIVHTSKNELLALLDINSVLDDEQS